MWTERFTSRMLSGFGGLALFLAFVGVYGVSSFMTRQRDREMGLRMALGASAPSLRRLVLRGAIGILAPGLAAGIVVAGGVSIALRNVLFGVPALDPITLGGTAMGLLGVGLLAAYLPARRVTRVDPSTALRQE